MILIRADANPQIGSGHVMRCLTIAKELKKLGQEVEFVAADRQGEKLITNNGFQITCLESKWDSLEEELPKLRDYISGMKVQAVLIDSYFVTKNYLEKVRELVKVIIIDDLNQFIYPVDLIINYNLYAQNFNYSNRYPEHVKYLLGCQYVPLREEFVGKRPLVKEKVENVLITTGGSDSLNIAGELIKQIRTLRIFDRMTLHVVVGPLNTNKAYLEQLAVDYPMIRLQKNVGRMSELMLSCDVAISAGGFTLYELCACGIPTISFSYADNQIPGASEFDRMQLIHYAGDMRQGADVCLAGIADRLVEYCDSKSLREHISARMQDLVDGAGARRISEALLMI